MELNIPLKSPLIALGHHVLVFVQGLGRVALFFLKGFVLIFSMPLQFNKILQQVYL